MNAVPQARGRPADICQASVVLLSVLLSVSCSSRSCSSVVSVLSVPSVLSALLVLSLSVLSLAGPCGRAGVHVLGGLPQPADIMRAPAGPTFHLVSGGGDASDGGLVPTPM